MPHITHKQVLSLPAFLKGRVLIIGFMRRLLLTFGVLTGLLFFSGVALATDYGLGATADAAGLSTGKDLTQIIGDVIGTALSLVSVLFFGLMLYAGIKWMLARGDSGQAEEALNTIIAAIIGLVVVLASYAITNFVFKSVGGGGATAPAGGGAPANPTCAAEGSGYDCRLATDCDSAKTSTKAGLCTGGKGCCAAKTAPAAVKSCLNVALSACTDFTANQTNCGPGEAEYPTNAECQTHVI